LPVPVAGHVDQLRRYPDKSPVLPDWHGTTEAYVLTPCSQRRVSQCLVDQLALAERRIDSYWGGNAGGQQVGDGAVAEVVGAMGGGWWGDRLGRGVFLNWW
jgi:hypothetical protein